MTLKYYLLYPLAILGLIWFSIFSEDVDYNPESYDINN